MADTDLVISLGVFLAALAIGALIVAALGLVLFRSERARSRAVLKLGVCEERLRAAEAVGAEIDTLRGAMAALTNEAASRRAAAAAAEAALARSDAARAEAAEAAGRLRAERDELALALERERADGRAAQAQIEQLKDAREQMRQSFGETARALFVEQSEAFKAQNSEQMGHILAPLKNDIDAFKKSLGEAHRLSAEQNGSLKEQLEQLARQTVSVSKEAEALTRALKGDVQMQGAWGEMIVDTILTRLGLREGVEYSRQESFSGDDGRVRTDYIVNLPAGERLIIDSKVSLVDFEAYVNAADDGERKLRLAGHARSMRAHMKGLAAKEYQARVGTKLDFVIMFVPIEAALGAALKADEALSLDALDNKVAIATPTTLTTQLKTVAAMWRVERQHKNAEDIAARAGALYDKFVGFTDDMQKLGASLGQVDRSYQEAMKKLSSGVGNLVRQTEMLKALGASTAKALPKPLLEEAGAADHAELVRIEEGPANREMPPTVQ